MRGRSLDLILSILPYDIISRNGNGEVEDTITIEISVIPIVDMNKAIS